MGTWKRNQIKNIFMVLYIIKIRSSFRFYIPFSWFFQIGRKKIGVHLLSIVHHKISEPEFATTALSPRGESEFSKSARFRRRNVLRMSTTGRRSGQIFITFIRELIGWNKAIDTHRRHSVWNAFYVSLEHYYKSLLLLAVSDDAFMSEIKVRQ